MNNMEMCQNYNSLLDGNDLLQQQQYIHVLFIAVFSFYYIYFIPIHTIISMGIGQIDCRLLLSRKFNLFLAILSIHFL